MALQKQVLSVSLSQGIDTKSDPKQVVAGKLLTLENGIFISPKRIRKRNGFTAYANGIGSPVTSFITSGQAIASYNSELIVCDKSTLYSWDQANTTWFSKGSFVSASVTQSPVVRNTYQQTQQDSATHSTGLQCFAWEDTQSGSRYSVVDTTTGQMVVANALIDTTAIKPKVIAIGNFLVILYVRTSDNKLYGAPVAVASPAAALAPVALTAASGTGAINATSPNYDATVVSTVAGRQLYVAFNNAAGGWTISSYPAANPTSASVTLPAITDPANAITVFPDLFKQGPVVAYYNGTSIKFRAFDSGLATNTLNSPATAAFTQGTGTLGAATYYYRVTALNGNGETLPNAETSLTITASHGVNVNWATVTGATQYKIYGRTTGAELLIGTVTAPTTTFLDNGSVTPAGAMPTVNSTTGFGIGTIETVGNVVSLTGISTSSSALALRLYYGISAAQTYNYLTRQNTVSGAYPATGGAPTIGTASVFLRSVSPAGKAFLYNSLTYLPLAYQSSVTAGSDLQPTYFLADQSGNLVAKIFSGLAGGIPTRASLGAAMLTESNPLSNGTSFQFAFLQKNLLTTQSGRVYAATGVTSVTVNFFDTQNSYLRANLGQNLHLCGGYLQMYDGISPVEHGFHLYPEAVSVSTSGSGGLITAGTYQYVVCYEWTDNQGQIHRSAPSTAVSVTTTGATSSNTVTIPTLRLTAKQGTRSPVLCVVYRTQNAGTTFYQVSSISAPTKNDTTVDTVTFTDTLADSAIIGNPTLYTTGTPAPLPNLAPNSVSSLTVHRNRIFAIDTTNPLSIPYSKQVVPGSPVEFSQGYLNFNVDPRGGNPTAVAGMDDKLIIFKSASIFFIYNQGPDSTGNNNDFPDATLVTTDVGCINPRSVVLTANGLMFQSTKGIYLLDRALAVSYIGAPVEAYNSQTITSAQQVPNANQIRFTLSSGIALVYDDQMGQWSVFTNVNAVDSTIFQNVHTYLTPAGVVNQETPGVFNDAGNFIKLRLVTSWLQFAGVQGFQRAYKALLLGEYATPHQLLVQVAYDFNPAFTQADTINPTTSILYGSDSVYGGGGGGSDSTVYGGTYPLYQWRVMLAQQKCEAIQLSIEDVSTGTADEAMNISALTLEVGIKRGGFKLPAGNTVG